MRRIFTFLLLAGIVGTVHAQSPREIKPNNFPFQHLRMGNEMVEKSLTRINSGRLAVDTKKQSSGIKYRIDSVMYDFGAGIIYYYNDPGFADYSIRYSAPGVPYERNDYFYDGNDRIIEKIAYSWDQASSQWLKIFKSNTFYTPNGEVDYLLVMNWVPPLMQWRNGSKTEYSYDASGNITSYQAFSWNVNNSQWIMYQEEAYTYNAMGILELIIFSVLNQAGTALEYYTKAEFFSSPGPPAFVDSIYGYQYDLANSSWYVTEKAIRTLLNATTGDMSQEIFVPVLPSGWNSVYKEEYYFDSLTNITELKSFIYNSSASAWENYQRRIRTFDNNSLLSDLYFPEYYQGQSKLLNDVYYDWNGSAFLATLTEDYYWSAVTTGLEESNNAIISVYPNPVTDMLYVTLPNNDEAMITITDLTGRLIHSQKFSSKLQIDASKWNQGIYIWNITASSTNSSGKILKSGR